MTTLELYRKHKKGEVSREKFLYEVRRDNNLPWITNLTSYNDAVTILKNKGIVTEVDTKEAKADEAVKAEVKAKAPSVKKVKELHIDQANPYEYRHGLQYELDQIGEYTDEALEKAKTTVLKNLAKDINFYSNLLNAKQSPFTFKATETDAKGMQANADGHLKKEAKKDEKSNVQDSLGKKEAGKKKPKGVKVMPDKGVTGSEKTIKEGAVNEIILKVYRYDPSSNDLEDVDVEYFGSEDEAKKAALAHHWQIAFDNGDTELSKDEFVAQTDWDNFEPYDNYSYDIVADKGNIKETFDDKKIKDKIESGEIKPEEVKAAAEKAMKGDSTSLIALMTGLKLSEDQENMEEKKDIVQLDRDDDHNNVYRMLDNTAKEVKKLKAELSYDGGFRDDSIVVFVVTKDGDYKLQQAIYNKVKELVKKNHRSFRISGTEQDSVGKISFSIDRKNNMKEDIQTSTPEDQFNQLVSQYDWYYEMSDDPRAYDRGTSMDNQLKALGKQIGVDKAVALFNDKAPSDRKVTSSFFMEGKEDKHSKLKEALKKALKEEDLQLTKLKKDEERKEKEMALIKKQQADILNKPGTQG